MTVLRNRSRPQLQLLLVAQSPPTTVLRNRSRLVLPMAQLQPLQLQVVAVAVAVVVVMSPLWTVLHRPRLLPPLQLQLQLQPLQLQPLQLQPLSTIPVEAAIVVVSCSRRLLLILWDRLQLLLLPPLAQLRLELSTTTTPVVVMIGRPSSSLLSDHPSRRPSSTSLSSPSGPSPTVSLFQATTRRSRAPMAAAPAATPVLLLPPLRPACLLLPHHGSGTVPGALLPTMRAQIAKCVVFLVLLQLAVPPSLASPPRIRLVRHLLPLLLPLVIILPTPLPRPRQSHPLLLRPAPSRLCQLWGCGI